MISPDRLSSLDLEIPGRAGKLAPRCFWAVMEVWPWGPSMGHHQLLSSTAPLLSFWLQGTKQLGSAVPFDHEGSDLEPVSHTLESHETMN